jgi:hypothetical protein
MASWVATAYTIRYGKANAGAGPAEFTPDSGSLGEDVGLPISLVDGMAMFEGGGGSIDEEEVGNVDGIMESGSAGIASSAEDVSNVICTVGFGVGR